MTAEIVSLNKWREDHPPMVRLTAITLHCWSAYFRLCGAIMHSVYRL